MNATEIIPGLWMGGEILPVEWYCFGAVLSAREVQGLVVNRFTEALLWLPLVDSLTPVPLWKIEAGTDFIARALGNPLRTLVHCTLGHNRSGLLVGAYLIRQGRSAAEAMALIRAKRPGALTNDTFCRQLEELDKAGGGAERAVNAPPRRIRGLSGPPGPGWT